MASGDLNGDGHPDIVLTRLGSGSVSVLLGSGKGGFAAGIDYPAGATVSNALVADFNGDGKLDVAVTDSATGSIDVLFGNGDGTFSKPAVYTGVKNPVALAAGYFTGSGKTDLAVASSTGVAILLNDGTGHFASAVAVPVTSQPRSLAAADLKAAGHDDLVLASQDGSITVLLSDGAGHFSAQPAISASAGPLSSMIAADFNGDGKADLAVTQESSNIVTVLLGRGDGSFSAGVNYTVGNGPAKVIAADLTGSGAIDLVSINQLSNTFSVLVGKGDGAFQPSVDFVAGNLPLGIVAGDFNSDGKADLAIANSQDQTLAVPLGHGDGTFAATRSYRAADLVSKSLAAGDLNGDGRADLVVSNYCGTDSACSSNGTATIFLANADGTYRAASTLALGNGPVAVALADLHGNNKLDLIALNSADKTLSILTGNGDGTFSATQHYALSTSPRAILVGDFNGDGKPDLAVASDCGQSACSQAGTLDIWLGRGDGSLAASASYTAGFSPVSIAAADLRSTGHLDVVVANACGNDSSCKSSGTATLFSNDGTGKLTAAGEIGLGAAPSAIAIGKLSGSGLDLVVAQRGSNQVSVLHADGKDGFGAPVSYAVGAAPSALAIADINGDGQADLAVANSQSSNVSILYGSVSGKLQSAVSYPVSANPESLVAIASGAGSPASLVTTNGSGATPMGGGFTPLGGPGTTTSSAALTNSPSSSAVNEQVTLSAVVTGTTTAPTGNVVFAIDNGGSTTPISDCAGSTGVTLTTGTTTSTATCITQQLPAGSLNLQAQYLGDTTYATSNSTDQAQTVTPASTTAGITTNPPATSTVDQSITVGADVSPTTPAANPADVVQFIGTMGISIHGGGQDLGCDAQSVLFNSANGTAAASCSTSALPAGSYSFDAIYNGDANYSASAAATTTSVTVQPAATTVTVNSVSPASPAIDQAITINAAVAPSSGSVIIPFSGTMSFYVGGTAIASCAAQTVNTTTGVATCADAAGLASGTQNITAAYNSGDSNYSASAQSVNFPVSVAKAATTVTVNSIAPTAPTVDQTVTVTATVAPTSGTSVGPFAGAMSFSVGGTAVTGCATQAVNTTTGVATCTIATGLAVGGPQSITAAYAGDTNYSASAQSAGFAVTVAQAATRASVSPSPSSSTVDQSVTLSALVTPNVSSNEVSTANIVAMTGSVRFSDSGTAISGCNSQPSTFSAASGTATATCVTSALAAGTHSNITAVYLGDSNYSSSPANTPTTVTVAKATPTIAVAANPAAPALNEAVTFTASITFPTPLSVAPLGTDTVSFSDNGTTITGCGTEAITVTGTANIYQATCNDPSLTTGGSHAIIATFTGDANYNSNTGNLSLSIGSASSTTTVTSGTNPSTVNSSVVFTISVKGGTSVGITGTATVTADGTNNLGQCTLGAANLTTGVAACNVTSSSLALGSHTISASYSGDSNYSSSSGSLSANQVVNAASTSLALASAPSPSTVNQSVTFTATLTYPSGGTTLTGAVAFTDNGATIGGCSAITPTTGGIATCNDNALTASATAHVIKATFTDTKGNFSTSAATLAGGQLVSAATGTLALSGSPNPSSYNQSVTFTATVTIPSGGVAPSGTVKFTDSVTSLAIAGCSAQTLNSNNIAQCVTTTLANGSHTITAAYTGDTNFTVNPVTTPQSVGSASTSVNISSTLNPSVVNQSVTFLATVSSAAQGTTPFTGNMSFQANGTAISGCTAKPVDGSTGQASCATSSLLVGSNTITAIYAGDSSFAGSSNTLVQKVTASTGSTITLTSSSSVPIESGVSVTFTAAITPTYTGGVPLTGAMVFTDTYVNQTGSTTIQLCSVPAGTGGFIAVGAGAGVATCKYVLPDGTNSVTASYVGDADFSATTSTAVSQIVEDYTLTVSPIPANAAGVEVTQGTGTTANPDPYPSQAISVTPSSISGYTGSLTLSCAAVPSSGAPACDLASKTLAVVTTGTQASVGITLDATSAQPGTYQFTVTATDASSLVRTFTFAVTVRSSSSALTLVSGATTGNTATIQFVVPANVTLPKAGTTFSCISVVGPELTSTYTPSQLSIGCSFSPATIPTSTSQQTATVTVTVSTGGTASAMNQPGGQPDSRSGSLLVAGIFGIPIFGLLSLIGGRKPARTIFLRLLAVIAICLAGWQVMGCGGSFSGTTTTGGGKTPPGVYNVLVQGTGSDGSTYQAVIKLNVIL